MTHTLRPTFAAAIAACLLAACGGGGGSGTDPAAPALALSGTAATGAAIAGATVNAKCATGTGTAVTKADGSFSIEIAGGSLPCVLQVAPAGGNALHSVIDGSGTGSATVNITPLTELVVAKLTADTPADLFASFDAAAQGKVTAAGLSTAIGAVVAALQGAVDLSGVNPIKDTLVAANGSTVGNALDQRLDQLQARLAAANVTLAQLASAMAGEGNTLTALRNTLRCPGLRSGRYVDLSVSGNEDAPLFYELDAATLVATMDGESPVTLTDVGDCRYSVVNDNSHEILVSHAGIHVTASTRTDPSSPVFGKADLSLAIPLQTIPLTELAGTWNVVDYFRETGTTTFVPGRGTVVVDGTAKVTAYTGCDSAGACQPESITDDAFSVNPGGGFDVGGSSAEPPSRAFAFKAANGQLSMFLMYSNGRGIMILTQSSELTVPAVGDTAHFLDLVIGADGYLTSPMADVTTTVTAVDATAGTFTRIRASDNRIDSFKTDDPQAGMRSRAANTCSANGTPVACAGIAVMPLPGTGVTTYISAAPANFFGISIARP